jgi:hypothetical protein
MTTSWVQRSVTMDGRPADDLIAHVDSYLGPIQGGWTCRPFEGPTRRDGVAVARPRQQAELSVDVRAGSGLDLGLQARHEVVPGENASLLDRGVDGSSELEGTVAVDGLRDHRDGSGERDRPAGGGEQDIERSPAGAGDGVDRQLAVEAGAVAREVPIMGPRGSGP